MRAFHSRYENLVDGKAIRIIKWTAAPSFVKFQRMVHARLLKERQVQEMLLPILLRKLPEDVAIFNVLPFLPKPDSTPDYQQCFQAHQKLISNMKRERQLWAAEQAMNNHHNGKTLQVAEPLTGRTFKWRPFNLLWEVPIQL